MRLNEEGYGKLRAVITELTRERDAAIAGRKIAESAVAGAYREAAEKIKWHDYEDSEFYICARCGALYQSMYGCGCPVEAIRKENA